MTDTQGSGRNLDLAGALHDVRARYAGRNPASATAFADACAAMPGGNTRSVLHFDPFPLTLVEGRGARVRDADGHTYVDFMGDYTAGLYGHSHPVIARAIEDALHSGIVRGAPGTGETRLATLICERFPSCERVRFTNSGTEANLMAITAARAHTGREAIMTFAGGYHGGVLLFAGGASPVNAPYPFVVGRYNDPVHATDLVERHADSLAAILVEPLMGTGGAIPAAPEFLAALSEAAERHGIVLILDEVMTSRLSPGGAQALYGIAPGMTTFGKYIGGGMNFGAFGGRAEIMDRFDPRRSDALPHAGTFNNNVLTMAAGAAGLADVYTPEVAKAHNARGDRLREALEASARARGAPVHLTGLGSMISTLR